MDGSCACGSCRFRVTRPPIVVHACYCTRCQRETGSALATNAVVETTAIDLLAGVPVTYQIPSGDGGKGPIVHRCTECGSALWSTYPKSGPALSFVRIGALDPGHGLQPDAHIFTTTRPPWVIIPDGAAQYDGFYNPPEVWGPEGLARVGAAQAAWDGDA